MPLVKRTQRQISTLPVELTCAFIENGKHIVKDAVLIPCCGHFICCNECIHEKMLKDKIVECPIKECDYELDSIKSLTPHHQIRKLANDYLNDVKLNKINKLDKPDACIDIFLNDEFINRSNNSFTLTTTTASIVATASSFAPLTSTIDSCSVNKSVDASLNRTVDVSSELTSNVKENNAIVLNAGVSKNYESLKTPIISPVFSNFSIISSNESLCVPILSEYQFYQYQKELRRK